MPITRAVLSSRRVERHNPYALNVRVKFFLLSRGFFSRCVWVRVSFRLSGPSYPIPRVAATPDPCSIFEQCAQKVHAQCGFRRLAHLDNLRLKRKCCASSAGFAQVLRNTCASSANVTQRPRANYLKTRISPGGPSHALEVCTE